MLKKLSDEFSGNLIYDLPASIVVFLVALPLCLGIALASGAPMFSGIAAGVIGGVVVGALSKSPLSVSGPAAGLASIVLLAINDLHSFPAFLCSVVIAGLLQILLGYLRAGVIGHFVPVAVIKGMLAAIGIILLLKQIPHAVGYDADFEGDESFLQPDGKNTFTDIIQAWDFLTPGAIVIALVSLLILILWERSFFKEHKIIKMIPGPLLVVLLGILLNAMFARYFQSLLIMPSHLVSFPEVSNSAGFASLFTFPDVSQLTNPKVYTVAITLALVASLETLLSIEAADKLDPYKRITPLNRELKSQGVANVLSGLVGGLPVTSVIVRTSANVAAGARTKLSAIVHGLFLMSAVILFPHFLELIPLSSLAAILLMVGYKLTSLKIVKEMYEKGITQFLPFLVTIIAILFSDLLTGVFIGLLVSIFFVIKTNFKSAVFIMNDGNNFILKFTKDVSFLNKSSLRKALEKIPRGASLMIDGGNAEFIDQDIISILEDYKNEAPSKNISLEIKKSNGAMNSFFRHNE
jgi:MFS superfamily sulfate permease-like transporter